MVELLFCKQQIGVRFSSGAKFSGQKESNFRHSCSQSKCHTIRRCPVQTHVADGAEVASARARRFGLVSSVVYTPRVIVEMRHMNAHARLRAQTSRPPVICVRSIGGEDEDFQCHLVNDGPVSCSPRRLPRLTSRIRQATICTQFVRLRSPGHRFVRDSCLVGLLRDTLT